MQITPTPNFGGNCREAIQIPYHYVRHKRGSTESICHHARG